MSDISAKREIVKVKRTIKSDIAQAKKNIDAKTEAKLRFKLIAILITINESVDVTLDDGSSMTKEALEKLSLDELEVLTVEALDFLEKQT